jgi:hypothetical protein
VHQLASVWHALHPREDVTPDESHTLCSVRFPLPAPRVWCPPGEGIRVGHAETQEAALRCHRLPEEVGSTQFRARQVRQ